MYLPSSCVSHLNSSQHAYTHAYVVAWPPSRPAFCFNNSHLTKQASLKTRQQTHARKSSAGHATYTLLLVKLSSCGPAAHGRPKVCAAAAACLLQHQLQHQKVRQPRHVLHRGPSHHCTQTTPHQHCCRPAFHLLLLLLSPHCHGGS